MLDRDVHNQVGILGATSLVGSSLLPALLQDNWRVVAYSRQMAAQHGDGISWRCLSSTDADSEKLPYWICLAPISILPNYFAMLETHGVKRLVVLSSTSRFSKLASTDTEEQALARSFADAEGNLQTWAESRGIEWVVLRPTLIYGFRLDKNITEIMRMIKRFGFFPIFGSAKGLRQPIHAADVAAACMAALLAPNAANHAYNISGSETLTYREMVTRIFAALHRPVRLLPIPLFMFRFAVAILRLIPRYSHWTVAMAERMNSDLVFEHSDAERDFGFAPKAFILDQRDLLG